MGVYSLDRSNLVNGRPAYQHVTDGSRWLAFDGAIWRGQPEADLGQKRGFLQLLDIGALTPDASAATWLAETGSGLAAQPHLKCIPCTPPPPLLPPPGLKLEGVLLPGAAAEYMGEYRLVVGKLVNRRPAYQNTSDATLWIAFDGESWRGQPESGLGQNKSFLKLTDSAAASPDVSTKTWKVSGGAGSGWVEAPQLKCTAWTPGKGGSLDPAAVALLLCCTVS
jgi:hypothetical protein